MGFQTVNLHGVNKAYTIRNKYIDFRPRKINKTFVPGEIPPGWQRNGKIQFENVCVRHEPGSPPILNNVNLTVGPGEKVNVVTARRYSLSLLTTYSNSIYLFS